MKKNLYVLMVVSVLLFIVNTMALLFVTTKILLTVCTILAISDLLAFCATVAFIIYDNEK